MPTIAEIMTTGLVTVDPKTTLVEATQILVKHRVTGLPVVNKAGKLLGIVSEKDLLRLTYALETMTYDSSDRTRTVEEVMTKDVVTFDVDDSLGDICKCLMDKPFRRVPILSDGKLVGVISRRDLLACQV